MNRDFFENLFVLELANNHLGSPARGKRIISEFAQVVRFNNVRAAIKLQFRDVDSFIHQDWRGRSDIRYIKKTLDTQLSRDELHGLVEAVRSTGCLTAATPFDEASVDLCSEFDLDFVKIASSDINDWMLIERIATLRKPVSFSTGGSSLKDIDDIVTFFERRGIPLAINHCVSLYPSEDSDLEINQIDFLRDRYPGHVIGYSSHEYKSWDASMYMAYAKGARTFERHIDIDSDDATVSAYCTRPAEADAWFKAYQRARSMAGAPSSERRNLPEEEIRYLDALVRGVYAKHKLEPGHVIGDDDVYLAIPLQKGQISCRELMRGEVITEAVEPNQPIGIRAIDSPYARNASLTKLIDERGVNPSAPQSNGKVSLPDETASGNGAALKHE